MIIMFYNTDSDVCVYEYDITEKTPVIVKKDLYYNNSEEKEFYSITGVKNTYLASIVKSIQNRFRGKEVIIFETNNQESLHDMVDMIDTLFLYRKEITILQASIKEDEVKDIIQWYAQHK